MCMCFVAQSGLTLCDLMHCGPLGSSVHGILQARILESVAMSSSRGSSQSMSPALQADSLPSEPQGNSEEAINHIKRTGQGKGDRSPEVERRLKLNMDR